MNHESNGFRFFETRGSLIFGPLTPPRIRKTDPIEENFDFFFFALHGVKNFFGRASKHVGRFFKRKFNRPSTVGRIVFSVTFLRANEIAFYQSLGALIIEKVCINSAGENVAILYFIEYDSGGPLWFCWVSWVEHGVKWTYDNRNDGYELRIPSFVLFASLPLDNQFYSISFLCASCPSHTQTHTNEREHKHTRSFSFIPSSPLQVSCSGGNACVSHRLVLYSNRSCTHVGQISGLYNTCEVARERRIGNDFASTLVWNALRFSTYITCPQNA